MPVGLADETSSPRQSRVLETAKRGWTSRLRLDTVFLFDAVR
jgi:hypothetical protein